MVGYDVRKDENKINGKFKWEENFLLGIFLHTLMFV